MRMLGAPRSTLAGGASDRSGDGPRGCGSPACRPRARRRARARQGATARCKQRDVVAERLAEAAGLEEVALHVDDDERRRRPVERDRLAAPRRAGWWLRMSPWLTALRDRSALRSKQAVCHCVQPGRGIGLRQIDRIFPDAWRCPAARGRDAGARFARDAFAQFVGSAICDVRLRSSSLMSEPHARDPPDSPDPEYPMSNSFERRHDILIDAPPEAVYDYVCNPNSWPEWLAASHHIDSADRALDAGEGFREQWHIRRGEVVLDWKVTESDRPNAWTVRAETDFIGPSSFATPSSGSATPPDIQGISTTHAVPRPPAPSRSSASTKRRRSGSPTSSGRSSSVGPRKARLNRRAD